MKQTTKQPAKRNNPKITKGETVSELAHRHLEDKNHETTDEEIRNVKLDLDPDVSSAHLPENADVLNEDDYKSKKEKRDDAEEDDIIHTPFDIISS